MMIIGISLWFQRDGELEELGEFSIFPFRQLLLGMFYLTLKKNVNLVWLTNFVGEQYCKYDSEALSWISIPTDFNRAIWKNTNSLSEYVLSGWSIIFWFMKSSNGYFLTLRWHSCQYGTTWRLLLLSSIGINSLLGQLLSFRHNIAIKQKYKN